MGGHSPVRAGQPLPADDVLDAGAPGGVAGRWCSPAFLVSLWSMPPLSCVISSSEKPVSNWSLAVRAMGLEVVAQPGLPL
jgi:hypothetical protein